MNLAKAIIACAAIGLHSGVQAEAPPVGEVPKDAVKLDPSKFPSETPFDHYRLRFDFRNVDVTKAPVLRLDDDIAIVLGGKGTGKEGPGAILGVSAPEIDSAGAPGEWQSLDVTYEQLKGKPAAVSAWMNGRQIHNSVKFERRGGSKSSGGGAGLRFASEGEQNESLGMAGDFTVMARFVTEDGGAIAARCNPSGEWVPGGKVVFVKGGRLAFDIGWVGVVTGKTRVNDGKPHTAVVVSKDGNVRMYVDGKLDAERGGFKAPDADKFVFKIGSCSDDFVSDFKGDISNVRFYERALNDEEIEALSKGEEKGVNTPVLNWKPGESPAAKVIANPKGPRIEIENAGAVELVNVWAQPLDTADHAALIAGLDQAAFERGEKIYSILCVTCHGDLEKEGSLPTALKFHEGEFKNGSSPHAMYNTLTKGFGMMVPQPQYDAGEKYDVIHYIREAFLKGRNEKQYVAVDDRYLALLPKPQTTYEPPKKGKREPQYKLMDFGPALMWTYQVEDKNIAYKAINVRLDTGPGGVSKGKAWMVYDHDTMRVAAAYSGTEFVDWKGIAFDGSHGTHTSIVGDILFTNPVGPGWAKPGSSDFSDPRMLGRDDNPYGPLPRDWVRYRGTYYHGNKTLIRYSVGDADVLELPGLDGGTRDPVYTRTMNIGKSSEDLILRVAPAGGVHVSMAGGDGCVLEDDNGFRVVRIPAGATPVNLRLAFGKSAKAGAPGEEPVAVLSEFTKGGLPRWQIPVVTQGVQGEDDGPFATDIITQPDTDANPWQSWMRTGGFDFFPDGDSAAVCTWMGDVWIVKGIKGTIGELEWQRICTGLFQPLGLKIVDGEIYVACRDQIARLHDYNGDGETDYIECFNSDHQVTEHFHEFAMGLQTDEEGNFYYAKSARHALKAVVPHHGTLLKVSKDGSETEIIASGFRAANGVCLNPDGTWIVTDQEGHWNPKNRINYVKKDGFYGNMYGYHDVTDSSDEAMEPPLCWITNGFDRSPAELLWVPEDAAWGPLNGSLLNLSYGYGQVYVVPHEKVDGMVQGGMCALPMPRFPTGVMRGRFHPENKQLYAGGLFAWAGNQRQPGGMYRVRATGKPQLLPIGLEAKKGGVTITLTDPLKKEEAGKPEHYQVKAWDLKRTASYGSKHFNERQWKVESVEVSEDGKSVFLRIPDIAPTWGMEIKCRLVGADGGEEERVIHNTIHVLADGEG